MPFRRVGLTAAAVFVATVAGALAAAPAPVPFTASRWSANGNATFLVKEAFPDGLMEVTSESEAGYATLNDGTFSNGTIEFDIKPVTDEMPGLRFRQGPDGTAEMLYIRVSPDCPASHDCLQYVPVIHGRILWDVYPQYQANAPIRVDSWNHIRMVISGQRMNVYVNREAEPSLSVAHLEGERSTGTLALEGKALYANLTIAPDVTDGLTPEPAADPTASDPSYIVQWEIAEPRPLPTADEPTLAAQPVTGWVPLRAEYAGLVNLSRRYPPTTKGAPRQFAWLRTTVMSDRKQNRHVRIGFLREVTVFVNGETVFTGKNRYNVPGGRRAPDGRLDLENGGFDLSLRKGRNEVVVAIDANTPDMRGRYGWGMKMKFDRAVGLTAK
jgi:hypothetical protein